MIRREYTTRIIEHAVDAPPHIGARLSAVHRLVEAAASDYRQAHGMPADGSIPDDALGLFGDGVEIAVRYSITQDATR